ncbi:hypothetical protein N5T98_04965 [Aliarcobacter cryaerophilus]|uniref:hypothetical protein n=1 Tax=Aliarcobacter cryaerophilus TaxID=28198 RepID=UPI0021B5CE31|nr:hypothetical protein [Aliarcobacter cryaerophilus]MCT7486376.1 hypothetical protein [Aliarcobacter cryaerophilus]MCT7490439.1 hypothetical protein [Aliarcobacter cryaerophilus]
MSDYQQAEIICNHPIEDNLKYQYDILIDAGTSVALKNLFDLLGYTIFFIDLCIENKNLELSELHSKKLII